MVTARRPAGLLLDTNILIEVIRGRAPQLKDRFIRHGPALATSSVVMAELVSGAMKSVEPEKSMGAVAAWLEQLDVLPFDADAAAEAGRVRAEVERNGTPIGSYDVQIAGHARATGRTVVTNNRRHFSRVEDLVVEDWLNSAQL